MYCPKCEAEVESTIRDVLETYPVKGEEITVNARVRFCKCCGTDMWDEELDEKNLLDAFEKYRKKYNLLQPREIRMIREKYCLSQTAFARVLGFGDKTITRYENGSIADAAQNNLIELVQSPKNFKLLLEKNKDMNAEFRKGMVVYIEGDAAAITTSDYTCRMATTARIVDEPDESDDYVLVNADEIDGDHNVWIYVLKTAVRPLEVN